MHYVSLDYLVQQSSRSCGTTSPSILEEPWIFMLVWFYHNLPGVWCSTYLSVLLSVREQYVPVWLTKVEPSDPPWTRRPTALMVFMVVYFLLNYMYQLLELYAFVVI